MSGQLIRIQTSRKVGTSGTHAFPINLAPSNTCLSGGPKPDQMALAFEDGVRSVAKRAAEEVAIAIALEVKVTVHCSNDRVGVRVMSWWIQIHFLTALREEKLLRSLTRLLHLNTDVWPLSSITGIYDILVDVIVVVLLVKITHHSSPDRASLTPLHEIPDT